MHDELTVYRNACVEKGPDYYDYENYTPTWSYDFEWHRPSEHIELGRSLGRGKYSEVFEAYDTIKDMKVVVKVLKPGRVCLRKYGKAK
jgi:casein kinase II subunit alpha